MKKHVKTILDAAEDAIIDCFSEYPKRFKFDFDSEETEDEDTLKIICQIEIDKDYEACLEFLVEVTDDKDILCEISDNIECFLKLIVDDDAVVFDREQIWICLALNKHVA